MTLVIDLMLYGPLPSDSIRITPVSVATDFRPGSFDQAGMGIKLRTINKVQTIEISGARGVRRGRLGEQNYNE